MKKIIAKTKEEKRLIYICLILALIVAVGDQLTKYIIVIDQELVFKPLAVIPNLFNIVSVRNTGAAWGIFHDSNCALLFIAFIAFLALIYFFRAITDGYPERYIALSFIFGGIVGNSIDRIFRGFVVDFFDFYFNSWHWPAFNVADSAICIGVCLLIISFLFRPVEKSPKA